jgi:3-hydroxyisobutyrate dehydrogenase-like beta-hydroxyacid dehydrogenase
MIGLGAMGFQMARHMADKGLSVAGYDIAPETCHKHTSLAKQKGIGVLDTPVVLGQQSADEGRHTV